MSDLMLVLLAVSILAGGITVAGVLVWWERRLLGFWQDRLGPNRIGPFGIGQLGADII